MLSYNVIRFSYNEVYYEKAACDRIIRTRA